ncbi:sterol desaturase family protein [Nocardia sp. NPDC004582]
MTDPETTSARALRRDLTLAAAAREFARHPSPWMIGATLVGALTTRIALGDWTIADAIIPLAIVALFPVYEWVIHVTILHWRPRALGRFTLDSELAREHRKHHADPRAIGLIFIPTRSLAAVIIAVLAVAVLVFPRVEAGVTFVLTITVVGLIYEWTHYLIHTDYKPKHAAYRSVWRHHRHHHYKNEHYWFTVTTANTADRLFGTAPDPATVATSPTARHLHGL